MHKKLHELMSPEDLERERIWAEQLAKTRADLLKLIEAGYKLKGKPEKRKALYVKWVEKIGKSRAMEAARCVEAILAGKSKIEQFRRFVPQESTETGVTQDKLR